MSVCYIVGAGDFYGSLAPRPGDLLIAADGGDRHLRRLGLRAQLVVGDFDSLGEVPEREGVIRHPVMKNDTDTLLAVKLGLERGFRRFAIYGGVGGRTDHTLANLQTLAFLAARGCTGFLMGDNETLTVLRSSSLSFLPAAAGTISVFAYGGTARGVTLRGLLYPLEDGVLTPDFPLGVSNAFTGAAASVSVTEGALLLRWEGDTGLLAAQEDGRSPR